MGKNHTEIGCFLFRSPALFSQYNQQEGFSDAFESKITFLKLFILSEQRAVASRTIWLVWEENLRIAQKEGHFSEDLNILVSAFQTSAKQTQTKTQNCKLQNALILLLRYWLAEFYPQEQTHL